MKKIKISFTTKVCVVAFLIMCVICAIAVGLNFAMYGVPAHADDVAVEAETSAEPASVFVVEKEVEKDDLATVFKNNILPYVVSGAEAFLALLIVIFPLVKTRGQLKALQGMYTVANKTIEAYKAKEGELTVENIANTVLGLLKEEISKNINDAIVANVKDTTGDINAIQGAVDVLSAQMTNLVQAAIIVWGEADGVKQLLLKSPTSQTLAGYLAEVKTLKAQVAANNADAIAPVEALEKELEVYDEVEQ